MGQQAKLDTEIRLAAPDDLADINAIYNAYVPISTCTYQEFPETDEERRRWYDSRGREHPVTVAVHETRVVGWGSLSVFRSRSAYRYTVEASVYVAEPWHGRGVGTALLSDLIERAVRLGHHAIVALIDSGQTISLALHAKQGFTEVGRLPQIGLKFGRWLDAVVMERVLSPPERVATPNS